MITFPSTFEKDIKSNQTSITPLIVINDNIYISANKGIFKNKNNIVHYFEDRDLKLSSIKESVDVIERKFKINNLTLKLNNFPVDNVRFSDFLANENLINKYVDVYYKTQSAESINDCVLIYRGAIRRFSHDSKSCNISLEDITEDKLSQKIPYATNFANDVYRAEDKRSPVPMCYGYVDKAPAVLFFETQNELTNKNRLYIAADDVFNTDRNLNLSGFYSGDFDYLLTQDEESEESYANVHPLFIYKDDYYRVLQNVDTSKIEFLTEDGWDWAEYEQYTVLSNYLSIEKKYNGSFPLNPPSNNEFQCIKIRYPKEIKMIPNPSDYSGEDASEVDSELLSVRFEQTGIKSPLFAIDNPIEDLKSKYIITDEHESSFASLPSFDDTLLTMEEDLIYVDDFRPHAYYSTAKGVTNISQEAWHEGAHQNYQWEIKSWLWRYAHNYNTDHYNPTISFIRMPSIKDVAYRVAERLEREFIKNIYEHYFPNKTPEEIEAGVNEATAQGATHDPANIDINWWFYNNATRHNMCYNMSENLNRNWAQRNGLDPVATSAYSRNDFAHPPSFPDNATTLIWRHGYMGYNTEDALYGTATDGYNYNDKRSYAYLCETQAPEYGKPENGFIKHGTEMMQFMGHRTHKWIYFPASWSSDPEFNQGVLENLNCNGKVYRPNPLFNDAYYLNREYGGWDSGFGYSHILVGTEASSLSYNTMFTGYYISGHDYQKTNYYNGKARYFNFFSPEALKIESNHEYLYENIDNFPIYSPIECTHKDHNHNYCVGIKYRAIWNGCDLSSIEGQEYQGQLARTNLSHDGGDQTKLWDWGAYEKVMSKNPTEENSGWHLWIRDDIIGVGGSELSPTIINEENFNFNPKLIIPKNTILACQHKGATHGGSGFTWQGWKFGLGETVSENPDFATIFAGESGADGSTEQRVGFVMPFADLDITDNIKCDTFFFGKVKVDVDVDSIPSSPAPRFLLEVGAADFSLAENSEGNLDWGVWDDSLNPLLDTIFGGSTSAMFSTFPTDANPDGTAFQGDTFVNDSLDERISQFHDPSNYNSLVLQYRADASNDSSAIGKSWNFKSNIYSAGIIHYLQFEGVLESDLYVDVVGRVNNNEDYIISPENVFLSKYTNQVISFDEFNVAENAPYVIEKPCDIIYHVLEQELGLTDIMDLDGIEKARIAHDSISNVAAFSLKEQIKAKQFIQDLCSNSNVLPLFKGTSKFSFATLAGEVSNEDMLIDSSDIIKYSFTRTPVEKIHTLVNVKYKKDYAKDKFLKETGYVDGYDFFGNGDSFSRQSRGYSGFSYDFLGLDRTEKVFTFEADYIRDEEAAKELRDYIFLWNCNQHNIFDLELPIKYMNLEVGDVVSFSSLIDNMKAYGEDYTANVTRNEQTILPYFIVISTDKKPKKMRIKVMQLHRLEGNFQPHQGSISRSIGVKSGFDEESEGTLILMEDLEGLLNFINGNSQFYTEKQKKVSDILQDGYINLDDYNALLDSLGVDNFLLGDLNLDASVNVVDVVALVNQILATQNIENALEIGDFNSDGILNVVDIIAMVNQVLGINN